MSSHPYITSQLLSDRHRARIASAGQHRLARQLRAPASTPRPAGRFARACAGRCASLSHATLPRWLDRRIPHLAIEPPETAPEPTREPTPEPVIAH